MLKRSCYDNCSQLSKDGVYCYFSAYIQQMINIQQLYIQANRVYTTSTQHIQLLYFLLTRFSNQEARYHLVEYGDYVVDMGDGIMGTAWRYVSL